MQGKSTAANRRGRLSIAVAGGISLLLAATLSIPAMAFAAGTQSESAAAQTPATNVVACALADLSQKAMADTGEAIEAKKPANQAVAWAYKMIGIDYQAGGSSPETGFDCSGLTMYVYAKAGVKLTHNAQAQFNETKSVKDKDLKPGDLVYFGGSTGSITHVGIYVGDGKYIHSPQTGEQVRVDNLSDRSNYVGATRPCK